MLEPKITIITVCYNCYKDLDKTLLSIVSQTYLNKELIVIDGESTDGTIEIIKKYQEYINKWVSEPDKGIFDAMNKGCKLASGDYINFMNAGDTFRHRKVLEKISKKLLNLDILCGVACIDNTHYWIPIHNNPKLEELLYGHNANHQSSFIKRHLLNYGYDTKYPIISDDLFLIKQIGINNCNYRRCFDIVCNYDANGLSSKTPWEIIKNEKLSFLINEIKCAVPDIYLSTRKLNLKEKIISRLLYLYFRIFNK